MTENKRFELCVDSNNRKSIWDNENNEGEPLLCLNRFNEMWGIDEVYDLLNALHEENIQLKGEVAHYKLLLMSLEKEAKRLSQIR